MKLYYSPGACSMAVHVLALETGLKLELVKVDIPNKKTENGDDFWKINPKGYVPALIMDNGDLITEVAVICQYLSDQVPASGMIAPFGTLERYQQMSTINFVATEVHKQIGALFNPALTSEMRAIQKETINRRLKTLDQMLAGRSYLMGDRFTAVDAYLFTVLNWTHIHKIDVSQWQNIPGYMERVGGREKVQQAMAEEGLRA